MKIFKNRNFAFLKGSIAVRFKSWEEDEGSKCRMITFTGGWVSIAGLPISMWNESNFEKIAEYCGGLIEIHQDTIIMKNYFEAKIKAKGNLNGFMPAGIQIGSRGSVFSLKLRNSSKLELGVRRFLMQKPISVMDFAFSGVCGEDEDTEHEDGEVGEEKDNGNPEKKGKEVGNIQEYGEKGGGVEKETLKQNFSDLIGVRRIFDNLKRDLGSPGVDSNKQLVVWKGSAGLTPNNVVKQKRLVLHRPCKMLKWLLKEHQSLRRQVWVPILYKRKGKSSHMEDREDIEGEVGTWETGITGQETNEDAVCCLQDEEGEMTNDPISSDEDIETCYGFEKDEKTNEWLTRLFEETEKESQGVLSQGKSLDEAKAKNITEVFEYSGNKLEGTKVRNSNSHYAHLSPF
ncbi:hypothetical protein LguiB_028140 [Lonicera macranthoides]